MRKKVSDDNYKRFHFWLIEHAKLFGVDKDPNIMNAIHIVLDAIESRLGTPDTKEKEDSNALNFWMLYKAKFLQCYDIQCLETLSPKLHKITKTLIEKLEQKSVDMEMYVDWLFDDFYENNTLSPNLGLSLSNNVLQQFFLENKEQIKRKLEEQRKQALYDETVKRARILIREANESDKEMLQTWVQQLRDGEISTSSFVNLIKAFDARKKSESASEHGE